MKLSGVMIGTSQAKVLGEFYTKLFGKPGWDQDDWYGFDIGGGSLMIGPHSDVHGQNSDAPRLMITLACDDVKSTYADFVNKGATSVAEPYQPDAASMPDAWLATISDPDGNYMQLMTPWEG